MSGDALRDKRRERVRFGMSTHGANKALQKRQAKRALAREARLVAPPGPEPEGIAPDPEPENTVYDSNWASIAWDEDDDVQDTP